MASVMRSCPWEQALRVVGTGCAACGRDSLVAIAEYLFSLLSKMALRNWVIGGAYSIHSSIEGSSSGLRTRGDSRRAFNCSNV
jgi:hypothetical protein